MSFFYGGYVFAWCDKCKGTTAAYMLEEREILCRDLRHLDWHVDGEYCICRGCLGMYNTDYLQIIATLDEPKVARRTTMDEMFMEYKPGEVIILR